MYTHTCMQLHDYDRGQCQTWARQVDFAENDLMLLKVTSLLPFKGCWMIKVAQCDWGAEVFRGFRLWHYTIKGIPLWQKVEDFKQYELKQVCRDGKHKTEKHLHRFNVSTPHLHSFWHKVSTTFMSYLDCFILQLLIFIDTSGQKP